MCSKDKIKISRVLWLKQMKATVKIFPFLKETAN